MNTRLQVAFSINTLQPGDAISQIPDDDRTRESDYACEHTLVEIGFQLAVVLVPWSLLDTRINLRVQLIHKFISLRLQVVVRVPKNL